MVYCYDCTRPNADDALLCVFCFSDHLTSDRARPRYVDPPSYAELAFPWHVVGAWPPGSVLSLAGGPGSGKSSLAGLLWPDNWLTSEESIPQAAQTLQRVQGMLRDLPDLGPGAVVRPRWDKAPEIQTVDGLDDFLTKLEFQVLGHLLAVDSLTAIGTVDEQAHALDAVIRWTRAHETRRALVILGVTKKGTGAGKMTIPHLVQIETLVEKDTGGNRVLHVKKNRHAPVSSVYFSLGPHGVAPAVLPFSYSVEGEPGDYRLVQYPTKGTKWAGVLAHTFKEGARSGYAGAGVMVKGYAHGVMTPADVAERQRFAERHGLIWLQPGKDLDDLKGQETAA